MKDIAVFSRGILYILQNSYFICLIMTLLNVLFLEREKEPIKVLTSFRTPQAQPFSLRENWWGRNIKKKRIASITNDWKKIYI